MNSELSVDRAPTSVRPLAPVSSRLGRTTIAILLAGAGWVCAARALAAPTVVGLGPPLIALGLAPLSIRKWWPGVLLSAWLRWLQEERWKRATGEPHSRAGAKRWLDRHSEISPRRVSALGLLGRTQEQRELLAELASDSPLDAWRFEYLKAWSDIAAGRAPNFAAVEVAAGRVTEDDQTSSALDRAAFVAYLRARNGARLGENGGDLLTAAARSLHPPIPLRVKLFVLVTRYRGPGISALILLALWALWR